MKKKKEKDRTSFTSGNLYPDTRYLGKVQREETHEKKYYLSDIYSSPTPSAFFEYFYRNSQIMEPVLLPLLAKEQRILDYVEKLNATLTQTFQSFEKSLRKTSEN